MRTNMVRNRTETDMNAAAFTEQARDAAKNLVTREEIRCYSRMAAYENVGRMIGASGSWVRKFVKGYEDSIPYAFGASIVALYARTCERIEKSAERLENETATRNSSLGKSMDKE